MTASCFGFSFLVEILAFSILIFQFDCAKCRGGSRISHWEGGMPISDAWCLSAKMCEKMEEFGPFLGWGHMPVAPPGSAWIYILEYFLTIYYLGYGFGNPYSQLA